MNDLQIDYFLAAARNLSFSKAAQELFVTQPAISRQIIALEQELGCPLFERFNKNIQLTDNGKSFYDYFASYRSGLCDLKIRAKLLMENKNRLIKLGVLNNWNIAPIIVPVLKKFNTLYPDVRIEINSYEPRSSQEALQAGKEDVVLTIEPKILNIHGILHKVVTELPRIILYHKSMESNGIPLSPKDFETCEFLTVSSEEYDYVSDLIRNVCKPYGFTPKVQPVHSTDSMIMGVQCKMGVAVADVWSRAIHNTDFAHVVLDSYHPLSLVWTNESNDKVIGDFIKLLEQSIVTQTSYN